MGSAAVIPLLRHVDGLRYLRASAAAEADEERCGREAQAHKDVVIEQTAVAELEAGRTEKRLQADVVKPAEADRDARIAKAQAEKREIELRAEAHAEKVKIEAAANAH